MRTKYWGNKLRMTTGGVADALVGVGQPDLLDVALNAFPRFNVGVTADMDPGASGEMGSMARDVPTMQVITSPGDQAHRAGHARVGAVLRARADRARLREDHRRGEQARSEPAATARRGVPRRPHADGAPPPSCSRGPLADVADVPGGRLRGERRGPGAGRPSNDLPQPYTTTRDWGELPPGVKWAAVTAIEPAPDGTIYVIHRCFANSCADRPEAPILKYNADGKLLASWGQGMFLFPHGATVDRGREPLGDRRARRRKEGPPGLPVRSQTARC